MSKNTKTDLTTLIRNNNRNVPANKKNIRQSLSQLNSKLSSMANLQRDSVRLVWCIDKTGSMATLIDNAIQASEKFFSCMSELDIQVEVMWAPFGDYCEYPSSGPSGLLEEHRFTSNPNELRQHILSTELVGGGDANEAYEYVLAHVANMQPVVSGLVLIGDANPHPVEEARRQIYEYGVRTQYNLNWRESASSLGAKGIPVYTFAMHSDCEAVFREISQLSGGVSGNLDDIESLLDMLALTAISLSKGASGLDAYMKRHGGDLHTAVLIYEKRLRLAYSKKE